MEAKLKAKELIKKFIEPTKVPNIKHIWVEDIDGAKQCALIAVDEIIEHINKSYINKQIVKGSVLYWEEIKEEISSYEN